MALDKASLTDSLKGLFQDAMNNNWDIDTVAAELANVIDTYTRSADVVQVTVTVKDASNNTLGTGTQTGTGKLQ